MSASGQRRAVRLRWQSLPVYPTKADDFRATLNSAEGPIGDSCIANGGSFEECVGASQECLWNSEPHFLCALQVNSQLELRGLLYG